MIGNTTTDQSGAYAVAVPPGVYRVDFVPLVTAPYAPQFWNQQPSIGTAALVDLTVGSVDGVNASLVTAYLVSGSVSHRSDGSATSANIHIRDSSRAHVGWATADGFGRYSTRVASGSYIFEFVPVGKYDATPLTILNVTVGNSDLTGVSGQIP